MSPVPARRSASIAPAPAERRMDRRYPVRFELRYKLTRKEQVVWRGTGRTRDFSRRGLFFTADQNLPVGAGAELCVDWPVLLNDVCPLQLVVFGRIIRSGESGSAVKIARCEFRTRSARTVPLSESIAQSHMVERRADKCREAS